MTRRPSCFGLVTDLYLLTMAASYLTRRMVEPATFSLFVRRLPDERNFLVAAGLDDVLELLESFAFDDATLAWLATQGFGSAALDAFAQLRFTGEVWAVPEGRIVFADEPILEVTAPLPEAQLVEALVLNQITYQTALTTKAARCRLAARGRADLIDFSLRRTHGVEAGAAAARAAAVAGFVGTSNVGAALDLGIRPMGTMAHSYITAFGDERAAFAAFAEDFEGRPTFLIDTYDTLSGLEAAIEVIDKADLGGPLGVRLDSGDLADLSRRCRDRLDAAGHGNVAIVASGGLDEMEVERLLDDGAPIDAFGVGTKVGVSADAPALDSAYKLVEFDGRPMMKLSPGKETLPGPKQVHRSVEPGHNDVIATRGEAVPDGCSPVLAPVMTAGRRVRRREPVTVIAERLSHDLEWLPAEARLLGERHQLQPIVSPTLTALAAEVRARAKAE